MADHAIALLYLSQALDVAVVPDQFRLYLDDLVTGSGNAADRPLRTIGKRDRRWARDRLDVALVVVFNLNDRDLTPLSRR